jgi:hypothetical protein
MRSAVILKSPNKKHSASQADLRIDRLIYPSLLLTCTSWLDLLSAQEIIQVILANPIHGAKTTCDQLSIFNKLYDRLAIDAEPLRRLVKCIDAFRWHVRLS